MPCLESEPQIYLKATVHYGALNVKETHYFQLDTPSLRRRYEEYKEEIKGDLLFIPFVVYLLSGYFQHNRKFTGQSPILSSILGDPYVHSKIYRISVREYDGRNNKVFTSYGTPAFSISPESVFCYPCQIDQLDEVSNHSIKYFTTSPKHELRPSLWRRATRGIANMSSSCIEKIVKFFE